MARRRRTISIERAVLQRIEKIKNASFRPTSATKNGASYTKSNTCASFLQDTRDGNGTQLEQVFGAGNTHVSPVSKKKNEKFTKNAAALQ